MSNELIEKVKKTFEERGSAAYQIAKKEILNERIEYKPLSDALQYFLQEELQYNVHHPALLSLACEAVNGESEKTTAVGAALILLTGAAHLHDDVIDLSKIKESKLTTFGKFGKDITILLGNILFFKGLTMLHEACEDLPKDQREFIIELVKRAFLEITIAETKEISLRGKWNINPKKFLSLLEEKAAVPELAARIGAMLGKGSPREIEALGKYGRNLGLLIAIREEFINTYEPDELMNRVENECLPLPIIYILRNAKARKDIRKILKKKKLTENDISRIINCFEVEEAQELQLEIQRLFFEGKAAISIIRNKKVKRHLFEALKATIVDLCD